MFVNEYEMTHKRYIKWMTAKFYKLPIFYIYVFVFILSAIAFWYFGKLKFDGFGRWQTLCVCLMFVSVYRGIFFRYLHASKSYRIKKSEAFGKNKWMCKVVIDLNHIEVFTNDEFKYRVHFDDVVSIVEAKSYATLKTRDETNSVRIDKESFTKGDYESFVKFIRGNKPNIKFEKENPSFDK